MKRLEKIISHSTKYLTSLVESNEFIKYRSFYGDTFCLALFKREEELTDELESKLVCRYVEYDKNNPEFHFEFNNYALLDSFSDSEFLKLINPLRFKNTPCTNWTLLRNCSKLKVNSEDDQAILEAKSKIKNLQLDSGLILDDPGVKSFQYHCFSAAMIGEIYLTTQDNFFLKRFNMAVSFIRNFILPNGKSLHIGRGQEQTFGYGALVYILALSYKLKKDQSLLSDIEKVISLLENEQREDGSFPLVLGGREPHPAYLVSMEDEKYCGWYPYNNFFDYLPFMTYFLSKAKTILQESDVEKLMKTESFDRPYRDSDFIKVIKDNYIAILSRPGGYWTNDLISPLIYSKNECLTPVYGGEQFQKSLYSVHDLSLPFYKKISLRFKCKSFFIKNSLVVISPLGLFIRKYKFLEKKITMVDKTLSLFPFRNSISELVEMKEKLDVTFSKEVIQQKRSYSASGRLLQSILPSWIKTSMEIK